MYFTSLESSVKGSGGKTSRLTRVSLQKHGLSEISGDAELELDSR